MVNKKKRFDQYRFQILPKNRFPQGELFGGYSSLAQLLDNKNAILAKALNQAYEFDLKKTPITIKLEKQLDSFFLLKLAPRRAVTVEDQHFEKHVIATWPSILIQFDNDPNEQTILIEQRKEAFQFSSAVANALASVLNDVLSKDNLKIFIEPQFKREDFWRVVENNVGSIKEIRFELITPNMANISAALNDDLKALAKKTNSEKTIVALSSSSDTNLKLAKGEDEVDSLVDYASQGGGNISVRIKGIRKLFHTSRRTQSVEIDEVQLESKSSSELIELLRLLKP